MKQKVRRFMAVSGLIVVLGLGASAITASAKTSTHKTTKTTISGKVTSAPKVVSGTQYTMVVKSGSKSYTVAFDTATDKLVNHKGGTLAVDKIASGNKVQVKGKVNSSGKKISSVSKITDNSVN